MRVIDRSADRTSIRPPQRTTLTGEGRSETTRARALVFVAAVGGKVDSALAIARRAHPDVDRAAFATHLLGLVESLLAAMPLDHATRTSHGWLRRLHRRIMATHAGRASLDVVGTAFWGDILFSLTGSRAPGEKARGAAVQTAAASSGSRSTGKRSRGSSPSIIDLSDDDEE
jgi:hypothetical protein